MRSVSGSNLVFVLPTQKVLHPKFSGLKTALVGRLATGLFVNAENFSGKPVIEN